MEGKITFGFSRRSFNGPTPARVARRIDLWSAIFGVMTVSVNSAPFFDSVQASSASWFLGLGVAILQALKPFYSVETDQKRVAIGDVDVMETQKPETDGKG